MKNTNKKRKRRRLITAESEIDSIHLLINRPAYVPYEEIPCNIYLFFVFNFIYLFSCKLSKFGMYLMFI